MPKPSGQGHRWKYSRFIGQSKSHGQTQSQASGKTGPAPNVGGHTAKTTHRVVDAESGTHIELITVPLSKYLGTSLVAQWLRIHLQCGRPGFNPWVIRSRFHPSPWRRDDNPLQYSCLENPMDSGARRATIRGVAESQTLLSN